MLRPKAGMYVPRLCHMSAKEVITFRHVVLKPGESVDLESSEHDQYCAYDADVKAYMLLLKGLKKAGTQAGRRSR